MPVSVYGKHILLLMDVNLTFRSNEHIYMMLKRNIKVITIKIFYLNFPDLPCFGLCIHWKYITLIV